MKNIVVRQYFRVLVFNPLILILPVRQIQRFPLGYLFWTSVGSMDFSEGWALLLLICRKSIEAEYDRQITNKYN